MLIRSRVTFMAHMPLENWHLYLLCWAWLAEATLGDPVVQWEAPLYHCHLQSSSGAKLT